VAILPRRGGRRIRWLVATGLAAAAASAVALPAALAGEPPVPAAPTHFATDGAGFLSETARLELDGKLRAYQASSGHQVLLWIGRTTGGTAIEDWSARAFAAWGVGRKGLDDGVVLFIMADDRKLRIEVGYGLEDRLTDARAASIIREQIAPRLRQGDRDGAARAGVAAILGALGGSGGGVVPVGQPGVPQPPRLGWGGLIALGLLGLLVIWFLVTHPTLAILFLTHLASTRGMRRGGGFGGSGGGFSAGGFSGGGFSGGGGRSGGGGATGSW
jgi:uncharacterized protein